MDIYLCKIPLHQTDEWIEKHLFLLSKIRQERIHRFVKTDARLRSLYAEYLLKYALKESFDISAEVLRFSFNAYQKPSLMDYPNIHFNLSHSGEYVACAVAEHEVGIDIQKIGNIRENIAERFYASEEKMVLDKLTEEEKRVCFFQYWTLKESYIKAVGEGLNISLQEVRFELPDPVFAIYRGVEDHTRKMLRFSPENEYEAAVCYSVMEPPFHVCDIKYLQGKEIV